MIDLAKQALEALHADVHPAYFADSPPRMERVIRAREKALSAIAALRSYVEAQPAVGELTDEDESPALAEILDALRIGRIACEWANKPAEVEKIGCAMDTARAALAAQRAKEAQQGAVAWLPFDYASPPDDGLMFVAVSAPETDCDVDDYGKTVGWHTGEVERSVALVHFSSGEGGEHDFQPVDSWNAGKVPAEGWVTHYMPVSLPKLPETAIAAMSTTKGAK